MSAEAQSYLIAQGYDKASVQAFLAFAAENRGIGRAFKRYAQEAAQSRKRVGAKAIMERVRWETEVERRGEFKVNNNFTSFYARLLAFYHPEFEEFFEFRRVKGLKAA